MSKKYGWSLLVVSLGLPSALAHAQSVTEVYQTPWDPAEAGDEFGAVLARGDFDSDGIDDIVYATPKEDDSAGRVDVGHVAVDYSNALADLSLWGRGRVANDFFGTGVAVGDFNGDHIADLAIGVPGRTQRNTQNANQANIGQVEIHLGGKSGLVWTRTLIPAQSLRTGTIYFGGAIAAGDFDGDGHDDLVVSVRGVNGAFGRVHVFPSGDTLGSYVFTAGDIGLTSDARSLGQPVVGDVNGDGRDDLVLQRGGTTLNVIDVALDVNVLHGSVWGLDLQRAYGFTLASLGIAEQAQDLIGNLVTGDFNGDGASDIAFGLFKHDGDRGKVVVVKSVPGSGAGLGAIFVYDQSDFGGAPEPGDGFGDELVAGDVDQDGLDDLAVSAPWENPSDLADSNGWVGLKYGSAGANPLTGNAAFYRDASGGTNAINYLGVSLLIAEDRGGGTSVYAQAPGYNQRRGRVLKAHF